MSRPAMKKADIPAIQKLVNNSTVIDHRPVIAYVMRNCGCTFQEIADALGFSRQMAETMFKSAETKLENNYEV